MCETEQVGCERAACLYGCTGTSKVVRGRLPAGCHRIRRIRWDCFQTERPLELDWGEVKRRGGLASLLLRPRGSREKRPALSLCRPIVQFPRRQGLLAACRCAEAYSDSVVYRQERTYADSRRQHHPRPTCPTSMIHISYQFRACEGKGT
jgi:hypothetical protein